MNCPHCNHEIGMSTADLAEHAFILMCYRLSSEQADEIAKLYRRFCPKSRIVFVTEGSSRASAPQEADAYVPESSGPQELLHALRAA